jgi:hypothetical protein
MPKKKLQVKVDDSFFTTRRMWWSEFCLTDNASFALFNVTAAMIKKLEVKKPEKFDLSPETLDMAFDRDALSPKVDDKKEIVQVDDDGTLDYDVFKWFQKSWPKMTIHKVNRFFGKKVKTLYVVLQVPMGKPVGLLKAK